MRYIVKTLYKSELAKNPAEKIKLNLKFSVRRTVRVLLTLILIYVVIASFCFCKFVTMQQEIFKYGSQLEVEYQRRGNLIPRLSEIAKNYAQHERNLMTYISDARTLKKSSEKLVKVLGPAKKMQVEKVFSKLIALAEQYPNLKADQSYQSLMSKIVITENRIALKREGYAVMINKYNLKIQTFPYIIFAKIFSFESINVYDPNKNPMPEKDNRFFFVY